MRQFPCPVEAGNRGDGSPLTLGDPAVIGDLFISFGGAVAIADWDGEGHNELIASPGGVLTFKVEGALPDNTPIADRGRRWGRTSRVPYREEQTDIGLCGQLLGTGDLDGDGRPEILLGPRGYSKAPPVVLSLKDGPPTHRSQGLPLSLKGAEFRWQSGPMAALDWDGDGRMDLVVAHLDTTGYYIDPTLGRVPEDQADRYTREGRWKGKEPVWSLHLFRNTGAKGSFAFAYAGPLPLPMTPPGGPLCAVDPADSGAGLLILGYYGDLWHLPLEPGPQPRWGALSELFTLHCAPFTRTANMMSLAVGHLDGSGRMDLFATDNSSNVYWCRAYGQDRDHRPVYDTPRKVKQRDPHLNGGCFSVPSVGDWRNTGMMDLVTGSIEGYVFWYKTLSTHPLRFAPPERVRRGDEEIRRMAKPNPAAGYHWGSSQGPQDGFNGGYSNPVLVDWDGDGLLDLLVGDMVGLYDWYPNRGTRQQPSLSHPLRLQVGGQPLRFPWRVQPGAADFTGTGLPDLVGMDLDLDLALFRRAGGGDLAALLPGEKLRYEDGKPIKTTGVYTPQGGDGRGRTKVQVVDWDGDGRLDLVLGVGPQPGSAFLGGYVLLCLNVGSNDRPVFRRPVPLLFDGQGAPLDLGGRHTADPAVVDWDGDGRWEMVVGSDQGFLWYFKPEHFGAPATPGAPVPTRKAGDLSL